MPALNHATNPPGPEESPAGYGRPEWPQPFRPALLMGSVGMSAITVLGFSTAAESWRSGYPLATIGYGGGASMMAMLTVAMLREAGFRLIGLSGKIRPVQDPTHGNGVSIPTSRMLAPLLIALLVAAAAYGVAASVGWFIGVDESLLPDGRNSRTGAIYMATLAAVAVTLALFASWIRVDIVVSIYGEGVERYSRRRILLSTKESEVFVRWQDITRIDGRTIDSFQHPGIDLQTSSAIPKKLRTPHDGEYKIALMAHALTSEPNTLFALLKRLHENPDDRKLISEPNAAELLRPPPLLERFRIARTLKREA
ncbi:hypothetical protein EV641_12079 [Rhodococcus sp. SMB37]|uniref:hypothetical protein n=1 Tax=Rhodococcus sp. SMB37 TaxID=2512213 RepID=UPI000AF5EB72|nr:hypothetical protein [Rhodococcus sp. SMB37]TCN46785.1 hypothetical protein EV641_12079 [Rhodococcus sp. SMB37]